MTEDCGLISKAGRPVPLQGISVKGDILGAGARVTIRQRYKNIENQPIEAIYKFPLPEGAAVCVFRIHLDGRVIKGQVEEREKAFEIYDEALDRGDGGYLLEQERPNIFTLMVGNLNPGMEVLVEIEYVTLMDWEGDKVRFFLPTTISPRYIPDRMPEREGIPEAARIHPEYAREVPYGLSLEMNIHDTSSIRSVDSPSHLLKIEIGDDPIRVTFYSETVRMDRDFILYCRRKEGTRSRAYAFQSGDERFMQLDLLLDHPRPAGEASAEVYRGGLEQEVVFLLDCSGSMSGDSIKEAKSALEISLRALPEGCLFNIIRFGSSYQSLYKESKELTEAGLREALAYLKNTEANLGGTELLAPLQAILETPPTKAGLAILLITDGEIGNEEEVIRVMEQHRASARLFTLGIGAGPNEYLVKALSRTGSGAYEFIFPGERIEPKVLRVFEKLLRKGIGDPVIQWGSGVIQAPESPILFPGYPATLFAKLGKGTFPEKVWLEGKMDGKPVAWEVEVILSDEPTLPIPILWARERIRDLEGKINGRDARRREGKADECREFLKQKVIAISRTYGLLSQETDFVAVEERAEADKTVSLAAVRKVPVLVTAGWHGINVLRDVSVSFCLSAERAPEPQNITSAR